MMHDSVGHAPDSIVILIATLFAFGVSINVTFIDQNLAVHILVPGQVGHPESRVVVGIQQVVLQIQVVGHQIQAEVLLQEVHQHLVQGILEVVLLLGSHLQAGNQILQVVVVPQHPLLVLLTQLAIHVLPVSRFLFLPAELPVRLLVPTDRVEMRDLMVEALQHYWTQYSFPV